MAANKGNCYLCGEGYAKGTYKKHYRSAHCREVQEMQECVLLKVEDSDTKNYWLFVDIPRTATLKTLDKFLREIWLECCGHLSQFRMGREEIGMSARIGFFPIGAKLNYEYDFGSTTELLITVVDVAKRPKQRKAVRLLARNTPYEFACSECGKAANFICCECMWKEEYPFFCEACQCEHVHDEVLPVVNSPRMGVCVYCGEFDDYEFDLQSVEKE